MLRSFLFATLSAVALTSASITGATENAAPKSAQVTSDIPDKFTIPNEDADYDKRVEMIPMRDGTKLYTVIVVPKGAKNAPIVLTRTPYNAKARANRMDSHSMLSTLPLADEIFVHDGYIRVYKDKIGRYGSEGAYIFNCPPVGQLNPTKVDHNPDAWDPFDRLVNKKKLPD